MRTLKAIMTEKPLIGYLLMCYLSLNLIDSISTKIIISKGGCEVNPLFTSMPFFIFTAIKYISVLIIFLTLIKLSKQSPKTAFFFLLGVSLLMLIVVIVNNFEIILRGGF
jgi:hypothetical protein